MEHHSDNSLAPLNFSLPKKLTRISRENRKLLVLDLDNTVCDFGINELDNNSPTIPRPYLHEFLKIVDEYYDITVWSATSHDIIQRKMRTLNILDNEYFKINCILTRDYMITKFMKCYNKYNLLQTENCVKYYYARRICAQYCLQACAVQTKPLEAIWNYSSRYNDTNTIIVDDMPTNFYFNVFNGLPISPYKQHMHGTDDELLHVGNYLVKLAKNCDDFSKLTHYNFKTYNPTP